MESRPPLGVMPTDIWIQKRKQDLTRAIHEYVAARIETKSILMWIEELRDLVERYP